jgi:hypothetical protein
MRPGEFKSPFAQPERGSARAEKSRDQGGLHPGRCGWGRWFRSRRVATLRGGACHSSLS